MEGIHPVIVSTFMVMRLSHFLVAKALFIHKGVIHNSAISIPDTNKPLPKQGLEDEKSLLKSVIELIKFKLLA